MPSDFVVRIRVLGLGLFSWGSGFGFRDYIRSFRFFFWGGVVGICRSDCFRFRVWLFLLGVRGFVWGIIMYLFRRFRVLGLGRRLGMILAHARLCSESPILGEARPCSMGADANSRVGRACPETLSRWGLGVFEV